MEATVQQEQTKTKSPTLTCKITGKSRPTNVKYLAAKAEQRNCSVEQFLQYYACKQAVKRLRAGMSVEDTRLALGADAITPVSEGIVQGILRLNGKTKSKK